MYKYTDGEVVATPDNNAAASSCSTTSVSSRHTSSHEIYNVKEQPATRKHLLTHSQSLQYSPPHRNGMPGGGGGGGGVHHAHSLPISLDKVDHVRLSAHTLSQMEKENSVGADGGHRPGSRRQQSQSQSPSLSGSEANSPGGMSWAVFMFLFLCKLLLCVSRTPIVSISSTNAVCVDSIQVYCHDSSVSAC